MEFEPISNISLNETFDPNENFYWERQNLMDIPIVLAATAGFVGDAIIIYLIIKEKLLRTRPNVYILNLCICNMFYLAFTPVNLNLFSAAEKIHASVICFIDDLFFLFMLSNYVFICIVLIDWYVVTYKSLNTSARCRASYKLIVATVWTVIFVFSITVVLRCTAGVSLFGFIALMAIFVYFFSFIFAAVMCILKFVKDKTSSVVEIKSHDELIYVVSYFLCWLPSWLFIVISIARMRFTVDVGLSTFAIGFLHPIVLLCLMCKKNDNFREAFRKYLLNSGSIETDNVENVEIPKEDEHFTTLI